VVPPGVHLAVETCACDLFGGAGAGQVRAVSDLAEPIAAAAEHLVVVTPQLCMKPALTWRNRSPPATGVGDTRDVAVVPSPSSPPLLPPSSRLTPAAPDRWKWGAERRAPHFFVTGSYR
jgi:hypothetical protein